MEKLHRSMAGVGGLGSGGGGGGKEPMLQWLHAHQPHTDSSVENTLA